MSNVKNKEADEVDFKHPEAQDEEVYYLNAYSQNDFDKLVAKSKRLGKQAYTLDSHLELPKLDGEWPKPVFVKKEYLL